MSQPFMMLRNLVASSWNYTDLKTRIIAPVLLALCLLMGLAGFGIYASENNRLQQELELRGQTITASLSAYATSSMTPDRKNQLENHVREFIQDKKLLHQVIIYQNQQPYLTITSGTLRQKLLPETLKHFRSIIYAADGKTETGHIEADLSTQTIDDQLYWLTVKLVLIGFALIVLSAILLTMLLSHTVIRPLERLANKIQTISMGRINDKVISMSWDEIGHLFRDINAMRVRFKSRESAFIGSLLQQRHQRSENIDIGGSKALIVDDDPTIQAIARKLLTDNNIHVAVASNGKQALETLQHERFDIILLDLMMPEMSGFEVLEQLKAHPVYNNIPVIVVSSITDKESIVRALSNGATDFVIKPFNYNELLARINIHLSKYLSDKEIENIIRNEMDSLKH
jgi:CheY-like chemotaxis protein/HAMP domain-containing protein